MDKVLEFRQIILVTDGKSNVGENPVLVAEEAYNRGITVSTIGITDDNKDEKPMAEIQKIANVGGGIWEFTDINKISQTMEMLTQKSVYKTIEETVSKELKEILGTGLEEIHPKSRKKIVDVIDRMENEINIKCCIVLDSSGSMAKKIDIARNSILNLFRVLKNRKGETKIAVVVYPGKNGELSDILVDFTDEITKLERNMLKINTGGTTPTGSALNMAMSLMLEEHKDKGILESNIV